MSAASREAAGAPAGPTEAEMTRWLTLFHTSNSESSTRNIKPSDLDYFHPNASYDWSEEEAFEHDGEIFRNVYIFCQRLTTLIDLNNWHNLNGAVDRSLMGEAFTWWNELESNTHISCIQGNTTENLLRQLKKRFKTLATEALAKLFNARYTMAGYHRRREPFEYLSTLKINIQGAGITDARIPKPTETDIMGKFMALLRRQQGNWLDNFLPRDLSAFRPRIRMFRNLTRAKDNVDAQRMGINPIHPRSEDQWPSIQYRNRSATSYECKHPHNPRSDLQPNPFRPNGRPSTPLSSYYPPVTNQFVWEENGDAFGNFPATSHTAMVRYNSRYRDPQGSSQGQQQPRAPQPNQSYIDSAPGPQRPSRGFKKENNDSQAYNLEGAQRDSDIQDANATQWYENNFEIETVHDGEAYHWQKTDESDGMESGEGKLEYYLSNMKPSPIPKQTRRHQYKTCSTELSMSNALFQHLVQTNHFSKTGKHALGDLPPHSFAYMSSWEEFLPITRSTSPPIGIGDGLGSHIFSYMKIQLRLMNGGRTISTCWDSGCAISLIDSRLLDITLPYYEIHTRAYPLIVVGIAGNRLVTSRYVILNIYIPGTDMYTRQPKQAVITRRFHLVDNLGPNMIIGMDVLVPEQCVVNFHRKTLRIGSCETDVPIDVFANDAQFYR
ncbi:hypothetical protein NHQ30_006735 [Ciborinia camelliae]|nr:hypothetical protein NHQ30_006735 [Ciborinia camelliae]